MTCAQLWKHAPLSTRRLTAQTAARAGISPVHPVIHTPYDYYEVLV